MDIKCMFLVLIALFSQASANHPLSLAIHEIPDGYVKDAFVNEIKKFSEEEIKKDSCRQQLLTIVKNLNTPNNASTFFHSFEVFDSWGKIPSGLTYGHITDVGNFQQCIHIDYNTLSVTTGQETNIVGKYCQAKIPITEIIKLVRPRNPLLADLARSGPHITTVSSPINLGIGICIPKVCNQKTISDILTNALRGVKVKVNTCSTIDKPEFETIDYVAACVFGLIGLLLVLSTIYDVYSEKAKIPRNESLLAFSVIHNSHKLFAINLNPIPNSINCLHGIRSLSMLWVILGHTLVWYILLPLLNLRMVPEWTRTPFALVAQNGVISVDTFFFLSGLLIVWVGLKEFEKNKGRVNVPLMYVHRLFRLIPIIAIVILFTVSFLKYFGSGPNWPTILLAQKYACERTWWRTLLFIQNYDNDLICLTPTWYLAVDMQLYLFAPLILFGLYKWGKKFIPVLVLARALSIGCVYATFITNNFNSVVALSGTPDQIRKTYYLTHTRYTIWLMGIIFGYIMTQLKNKQVKIPTLYNCLAWAAVIAIVASVVFGPYHTQQKGYEATPAEAATYDAFSRVGWGFALSWIIFACHHGYGGVINDFLSHPVWQVISKLSFCMYMCHFLVLLVVFGNTQGSLYFGNFDALGKFWAAFGWSLLAATFLVLTCEAPIIALEKMLFARRRKKTENIQESKNVDPAVEGGQV